MEQQSIDELHSKLDSLLEAIPKVENVVETVSVLADIAEGLSVTLQQMCFMAENMEDSSSNAVRNVQGVNEYLDEIKVKLSVLRNE